MFLVLWFWDLLFSRFCKKRKKNLGEKKLQKLKIFLFGEKPTNL